MARERISVDPHQRSRRRQQPGGGKHFMPAIIGLLMLLVFAGAAGGYIYEKKYNLSIIHRIFASNSMSLEE